MKAVSFVALMLLIALAASADEPENKDYQSWGGFDAGADEGSSELSDSIDRERELRFQQQELKRQRRHLEMQILEHDVKHPGLGRP